jgi:hypothetical protein
MKRIRLNNLLFSIVTVPLSFLFVSLRRDYLHRAMRKLEVSARTRFVRTKEIIVRFVGFEVMFLYLGRFKLLLIHTYHRLIVGFFYSNSKIAEKKTVFAE